MENIHYDNGDLMLQDMINYFGQFENVNQLPEIDSVINDLKKISEEIEVFFDKRFEGINFKLKDGKECVLIYGYECILNSFSDKEDVGLYIYKNKDEDFLSMRF